MNLLGGLTVLLLCQSAGEVLARLLQLPLPGPVLGCCCCSCCWCGAAGARAVGAAARRCWRICRCCSCRWAWA